MGKVGIDAVYNYTDVGMKLMIDMFMSPMSDARCGNDIMINMFMSPINH